MTTVGEKLRQERLRQGLELTSIADKLCIGSRYLKAIESGDWKSLPGGFFTRSFVRQYAPSLGLDPAQFEQDLNDVAPAEAALPVIEATSGARAIDVPPMPAAGHRERRFDPRILASVAVLIGVAWGGSVLYAWWQKSRVEAVSEPPTQPQPEVAATAPKAFEPKPAQPEAASPSQPQSEPAADLVPASAPPPEPPAAAPVVVEGGDSVSIEILATEKTWIDVSSNGKRIFSGVLEAGQSRQLTSGQHARLIVGNAAGLTVRRKGKDIGPIGPRGGVRVVKLSPESVEIEPLGKPGTD